MEIISELFFNFLVFLHTTTGSLGYAILVFTFLVRSALLPLTLPSLRSREKITQLQPEINKLKKKHKNNKQEFQKAQLDLYKKYNVNPLSGCIPQLVQIGLLILIYRTLLQFLDVTEVAGVTLQVNFFWLDLTKPDPTKILPILTAASQLVLSLLIAPGAEKRDIVPNNSTKKKIQEENKKEEDFAEMAASMQKQMIFIMPVMTGFIALSFPSGVALYWVATTIFSIGQQLYISGPGGLSVYSKRALAYFAK